MRPDDRRRDRREGEGGIPDGLLVGILAFLLGMTLLVWSATGLAGLFSKGSWPEAVSFTRTPLAMRHLIGKPHDITGAWPATPKAQLSGYGLFWGLFIGQLMVLFVLTVFVMGTTARWRAGRARRRLERTAAIERATAAATEPLPHPEPLPQQQPTPQQPTEGYGVHEVPVPRAEPAPPPPHPTDTGHPLSPSTTGLVHYAPPASRQETATQAVRDAEGPTLVVTSNPAVWSDTKDARAKLGPVHLYDPAHRCDTPARLHWSPTAGCEDKQTATSRATALLAPIRPTAKLDQALSATAETLLRCYLHAAAVDGRTIRHVHRWSQGTQIQDAVRVLRTNPKAAAGSAGELEAALTAHPERRDMAQELTSRALSSLFTVNIREACTPNRTDALALDSFVDEGGTLYVVGESIEDPRTNPGAMPLLTALVSSVVERGRRMAERSSAGRLDPPLTLVLDDVAAVAPLPQLPELLATGADRGLPTLALLRSREQGRARWPHDELPV
ncbi:type IV secretory system conjugative DNA transfer family protein [Streptomyces cylindrosporus]|uniref:Type IV secretory system conjugative DNA transfer family protein n=1 Tax=Streptomyces cylindrosporus TaxID=2927583 RepID=A0ABS9Y4P4_9ACTN|nr:type IV secretory system conjugative DNA transfer family protein [Streptomyces cylindrosporus]MCI3271979.1 type IV secretory system conjugative DNA transfer family protein [Streptomyces cylindrosporus]